MGITKAQVLLIIFKNHFCNYLVYLLLATAGLLFLAGELHDAVVILIILVFNTLWGGWQEWRISQLVTRLFGANCAEPSFCHLGPPPILQVQLKNLTFSIMVMLGVLSIFFWMLGWWQHLPVTILLGSWIGIVVCIIPEGLPLVLTLILVRSAQALLHTYDVKSQHNWQQFNEDWQHAPRIFYAMRRALQFFLTVNLGQLGVLLGAMMLQLPLPLLAPHLLWLNIVTDGFLNLALACEPLPVTSVPSGRIDKMEHLVDRQLLKKICFVASIIMILGLLSFNYFLLNLRNARAFTMIVLTVCQVVLAFRLSGAKWWRSYWLLVGSLVVLVGQMIFVFAAGIID